MEASSTVDKVIDVGLQVVDTAKFAAGYKAGLWTGLCVGGGLGAGFGMIFAGLIIWLM